MKTNKFECYVRVTGDATDADDEGVQGIYQISVTLSKEVILADLSVDEKSKIATAVLDEFHDRQGIENLEDFSITALLPDGQEIFEGDDVWDGKLGSESDVPDFVTDASYLDKIDEKSCPFEVKPHPQSRPTC